LTERGLDEDGTIVREGALDRVPAAFVPVVDAARERITTTFGGPRLHSAYLYGSIPRGTAVPRVSDLDLLIVFRDEPAAADRAAADALEAALVLPRWRARPSRRNGGPVAVDARLVPRPFGKNSYCPNGPWCYGPDSSGAGPRPPPR